jgi:hypothetical protein
LRVWEQGGTTGKLEVQLPAGEKFNIAIPVNLRGEIIGEPVKITGGRLLFDLHAYAPGSFLLE